MLLTHIATNKGLRKFGFVWLFFSWKALYLERNMLNMSVMCGKINLTQLKRAIGVRTTLITKKKII